MSGLVKRHDGITPFIQRMLLNAQNKAGAFARVYPLYQKLQMERFQTENASEGEHWHLLKPDYEKYKLKRYGGGARHRWVGGQGEGRPWEEVGSWKSWPGGGRKMLMGTSSLAGAVIGQSTDSSLMGTDLHRVMFSEERMTVSIDTGGTNAEGHPFEYAKYVAERRPFFKFGTESIQKMQSTVMQFMLGVIEE